MSNPLDAAYWMVFDVESVGLYGDGFAVGYTVMDAKTGKRLEDKGIWSLGAHGDLGGFEWVKENVIPILHKPPRPDLGDRMERIVGVDGVRTWFYFRWYEWLARCEEEGTSILMAADVPWPVEARFLDACIRDQRSRRLSAPYPLIDIASIRFAAGLNPLATCERLEDEKPAHHPLADARQSARLLWEALVILRRQREQLDLHFQHTEQARLNFYKDYRPIDQAAAGGES